MKRHSFQLENLKPVQHESVNRVEVCLHSLAELARRGPYFLDPKTADVHLTRQ